MAEARQRIFEHYSRVNAQTLWLYPYAHLSSDLASPRMAQKVGEEGTEVVVAALSQENKRLIEEIADLTYHVMVLMAAKGITLEDVAGELEKRHK